MDQVAFRSCGPNPTTYVCDCGEGTGFACPEGGKIYRFIINNVRSEDCWEIVYGLPMYSIPVNVQYDPSYPTPYETCNECYQYNYKLVNCIDDTVIYTNYLECPDCINYINQLAYTYLEPNPCWYVTVTNEPVGPITLVEINLEAYCDPCVSYCYTITGTGIVTYIDQYNELLTADAPVVICSSSYPSVSGSNHQIFRNTDCIGGNVCPYYIYTLTNCETGETIRTDNQALAFPDALNQTVKLGEYPNACWEITSKQSFE